MAARVGVTEPVIFQNFAAGLLIGLSRAWACGSVRDALKAQGFGVLTEIDVRATLDSLQDTDRPAHGA